MEAKYQLHDGEKVLKIIVGHSIFYARLFFIFLILVSILSLIYIYWGDMKLLWVGDLVVLQIYLAYLYKSLMDYEFQKIIVTNFRIIGFKKDKFFQYHFEEFFYDNIFEIKAIKKGVLQNSFDYGNILFFSKENSEILGVINIAQPGENARFIHDTSNTYFKEFNKK